MSEPIWTTKPIARPQPTDFRHESVIDGLKVYINEKGDTTDWTVEGWLADVHTFGSDYNGYRRPIDEAKAQAIAAAHRLYAAGVRGEISYPVSCCDRLLPTRADAERREAEHRAELAVIHFAPHSLTVACDADPEPIWEEGRWTENPSAVTCPACREWVGENDASHAAGVGSAPGGPVHPGDNSPIAAEEADSEHEARVVAREQARRGRDASRAFESEEEAHREADRLNAALPTGSLLPSGWSPFTTRPLTAEEVVTATGSKLVAPCPECRMRGGHRMDCSTGRQEAIAREDRAREARASERPDRDEQDAAIGMYIDPEAEEAEEIAEIAGGEEGR